MQQIEAEVTALNAEVARLRIMVERCVDVQQQQQRAQQQQQQPAPALFGGFADPRVGTVPPMPLPGQPLAVLPVLFSGMEGTARLFRILMETYPWLTPPEVREAAEIVRNEKALAAEERRRRNERRKQKLAESDSDENDAPGTCDKPPLAKRSHGTPQPQQLAQPATTVDPISLAAAGSANGPNQPEPVERPGISPFPVSAVFGSAGGLTPRTLSPLPKKSTIVPVADGVLLNRRPSGKVNMQRIKAFGVEDNSDDSSDNGPRAVAAVAPVFAGQQESRNPDDEHDF